MYQLSRQLQTCLRCSGGNLKRIDKRTMRCSSCGAYLRLSSPRAETAQQTERIEARHKRKLAALHASIGKDWNMPESRKIMRERNEAQAAEIAALKQELARWERRMNVLARAYKTQVQNGTEITITVDVAREATFPDSGRVFAQNLDFAIEALNADPDIGLSTTKIIVDELLEENYQLHAELRQALHNNQSEE